MSRCEEDTRITSNVYAKASAANAAPPAATSAPNAASNDRFEGPVIPMCVYLHNKTVIMMEIEDTPSATCELICQAIVNSEELGLNKQLAAQVFTLWMISPILEIQLKPYSKPYEMRQNWRNLIEKYGHASEGRMEKDEPKLVFQRNIFVAKQLEERIKDQKILELLYEECKYNVLNGRYPSEIAYLIMLGGIQAREELGPYNLQISSRLSLAIRFTNIVVQEAADGPTSGFAVGGQDLQQTADQQKSRTLDSFFVRSLQKAWSAKVKDKPMIKTADIWKRDTNI
ncbi:hypothetical protein HUJ04_013118 [Dendroctonus ponderosae]|nr:hypothetical protein HUJ04_013118 [Dendroctonus ponderosae]